MKKMKHYVAFALALCASVGAIAQTQTLFDDGWQFTREGKTVTVNLPHDWDIYEAPNPATGATGTGGGWYPGGKGEYRKTFKTPDADVVKLYFEGVYQKAEVFVNGQKAGQHAYGYTPFTVDITPYLNKASNLNEVVVKVNNSEQPNCRWYSGSGIYRHVWLQTKRKQYIDEWSVSVATPDIHTHGNAGMSDDAFQFLINLVCHEADTDVCLYPPFCEVEYGAHLQIPFANPECFFNYPKSVVLVDDVLLPQICIGDVALQPVPSLVLGNPLLTDGDLHVLTDLKELVVSSFVDLVLGKFPCTI